MKLFPSKTFNVELRENHSIVIARLERKTDITDSLVSARTDKEFRGQVKRNKFKLISSEIGYGALCILIGQFDGKLGKIEIRLHKAFKVMFSILMLLPIIGFGIAVFTVGIENSYGLVIPLLMGILFIRYALLELSFRFSSKTGLDKLTKILGITKLEKNEVQQYL